MNTEKAVTLHDITNATDAEIDQLLGTSEPEPEPPKGSANPFWAGVEEMAVAAMAKALVDAGKGYAVPQALEAWNGPKSWDGRQVVKAFHGIDSTGGHNGCFVVVVDLEHPRDAIDETPQDFTGFAVTVLKTRDLKILIYTAE